MSLSEIPLSGGQSTPLAAQVNEYGMPMVRLELFFLVIQTMLLQ